MQPASFVRELPTVGYSTQETSLEMKKKTVSDLQNILYNAFQVSNTYRQFEIIINLGPVKPFSSVLLGF